MIWLLSEENKGAFYKLKNNIVGGASIVFHRYHEKIKLKFVELIMIRTQRNGLIQVMEKLLKRL